MTRNHLNCRVCGKAHSNPRSSSICPDCGKLESAKRIEQETLYREHRPCMSCGDMHTNPISRNICPPCHADENKVEPEFNTGTLYDLYQVKLYPQCEGEVLVGLYPSLAEAVKAAIDQHVETQGSYTDVVVLNSAGVALYNFEATDTFGQFPDSCIVVSRA